jgi:hypothetical protein
MWSARVRVCAGMALVGCCLPSMVWAVPLSTLLAPGATLTSSNGAVTFSNFIYMTTVGAPNATAVDVSADASVPGGLRVEGPFLAANGDSVDVIFGFDAQISGGAFTAAEMNLLVSSALGTLTDPGGQVLAQSSALIVEEITPLPGPGPETDVVVLNDVIGPDQLSDSVALSPAVYGSTIRVRKDMGLISVPIPQGGGLASITVFTQNFVPEPATLLLLLAGAVTVMRHRRHSPRIAGKLIR